MKKLIISLCLVVLFLCGCDINNNPTSKVDELFNKYQTVDDSVSLNYYLIVNNDSISSDLTDKYKELAIKQYKNMSYEIKEEKIDGDKATVTVEVNVFDYKKIMEDNPNDGDSNYYNKLASKLDKAKDMATYTIDFASTKDDKGEWKLDNLTSEEELKLLGMY